MNCDICNKPLTEDAPANSEYCTECFHLLRFFRSYLALRYPCSETEAGVMPDTTFLYLSGAIDPLDTVEIVMDIEDIFNMHIPDDDAESIKDIRQLICYLRNRGASWPSNRILKPIMKQGFFFGNRIRGWEPVDKDCQPDRKFKPIKKRFLFWHYTAWEPLDKEVLSCNCDICHKPLTEESHPNSKYCTECFHLLRWVRGHYGPEDDSFITPDTTYMELNADSLEHIDLVLDAEHSFNINIPDTEVDMMYELKNIRGVICYLKSHGVSWPANRELRPVEKRFFCQLDEWEVVNKDTDL